jgi:hypothetical protein
MVNIRTISFRITERIMHFFPHSDFYPSYYFIKKQDVSNTGSASIFRNLKRLNWWTSETKLFCVTGLDLGKEVVHYSNIRRWTKCRKYNVK